MPTYPPQNLPYPQPSDAPDGPGAILALAQALGGVGGVQPDTTLAALNAVPGVFTGQLGNVTGDGVNNGLYQWNGSWVRIGRVPATVAATPGSNWGSPSVNLVSLSAGGEIAFSFNATCTANLAVGATIAAIPTGYNGTVNAYAQAWGLLGAQNTIQVYYDFSSHTVKLNQALTSGQAIAATLQWVSA